MKNLYEEGVWLTRNVYEDAEIAYYENLSRQHHQAKTLAGEIAKVRDKISRSKNMIAPEMLNSTLDPAIINLFKEKMNVFERIEKTMNSLIEEVRSLNSRVTAIEEAAKNEANVSKHVIKDERKPEVAIVEDDVDLFASDSDEGSAEAAKIRDERLAAYAAKKSKKPILIAKSNVVLDIKPWSDETDMKVMEEKVRKIKADGLLWGASKLVPLAFGINKLQISCVVEDDKISIDWLMEVIEAINEFVQSVDIAAFNKI